MKIYRITYSDGSWFDETASDNESATRLANKFAKIYDLTVESVKLVRS